MDTWAVEDPSALYILFLYSILIQAPILTRKCILCGGRRPLQPLISSRVPLVLRSMNKKEREMVKVLVQERETDEQRRITKRPKTKKKTYQEPRTKTKRRE